MLAGRRRARIAARAGRGTTGTRRGSCRSRSARGSACGGRSRWPPSRRPGPASAPRTRPRTRRGRRARRARAGRRREARPSSGSAVVPRRAAGPGVRAHGAANSTLPPGISIECSIWWHGPRGRWSRPNRAIGPVPGARRAIDADGSRDAYPACDGSRGNVRTSKVRGAAGRDRRGNRSLSVRAVGAVRARVDRTEHGRLHDPVDRVLGPGDRRCVLVVCSRTARTRAATAVEVEGPAFTRYLFSNTRAGLFWLPIRLFVGFSWLAAGYAQVQRRRAGSTAAPRCWASGRVRSRSRTRRAALRSPSTGIATSSTPDQQRCPDLVRLAHRLR